MWTRSGNTLNVDTDTRLPGEHSSTNICFPGRWFGQSSSGVYVFPLFRLSDTTTGASGRDGSQKEYGTHWVKKYVGVSYSLSPFLTVKCFLLYVYHVCTLLHKLSD